MRNSPVGSLAARKRYSLVVWLPASIRRYWPVAGFCPMPRYETFIFFEENQGVRLNGCAEVWRKMWSWRLVVSSSVE